MALRAADLEGNRLSELGYKGAVHDWTCPASVNVAERLLGAACFEFNRKGCLVDAGPEVAKNTRALMSSKESDERK